MCPGPTFGAQAFCNTIELGTMSLDCVVMLLTHYPSFYLLLLFVIAALKISIVLRLNIINELSIIDMTGS
jgi:hypothetical protein